MTGPAAPPLGVGSAWPGGRALTTTPVNAALDLSAAVGQMTYTYRFALSDGVSGEVLGDIHPIRTGTLSHDTSRTTKRSLSLQLGKADTAAVNTATDRIGLFMTIPGARNPDRADGDWPLGRYQFVDDSLRQFTSGMLSDPQLTDEMFLVDQAILKGISGVGRGVVAVLVDTLSELPIAFDVEPSPFTSADAWGIGAARGQILDTLAVAGDFWCMAPETKILDADLRWRPLGELTPGDELVGFDEDVAKGPSQRYRRSVVDSVNRRVLECFEVDTEFGTTVASADHLWLVKRPVPARTGHRRSWKRTADLVPGDRIVAFGAPWEEDRTRDGGYLAGIYDGEASLALPGGRGAYTSKIPRLSFAQKPGLVLDFVRQLLTERGYDYREGKNQSSGVMTLMLRGGKYEAMRFLGSIRPERLLPKATTLWEGRGTWSTQSAHTNHVPVLAIRPVGKREVVAIGTSTKTLIADGLLTHNSPWFDNSGVLRFRRTFDPALAIPDIDFDAGYKVIRNDIVRTNDLLSSPNTIIVISNNSASGEPAVGVATVAVNAPNSVANRGFAIAKVADLQLSDSTQAQAVANGLIQRQAIFEQVALSTPADPRHDGYNVIRWQRENWLELAWSMPLEPGAPMTHTLRRSYLRPGRIS